MNQQRPRLERLRNRSLQAYLAIRGNSESLQAENSDPHITQGVTPTIDFDKYVNRQFMWESIATTVGDGNLTIALNDSQFVLNIDEIVLEKVDGTWTFNDILLSRNPIHTLRLGNNGSDPTRLIVQAFGSGNGFDNVGGNDRTLGYELAPQEQLLTVISGHSVAGDLIIRMYGTAWFRPDIPL